MVMTVVVKWAHELVNTRERKVAGPGMEGAGLSGPVLI